MALHSNIAISWSTGEAVTVNTRALIDKVLARYSAKYTVFRELFQNASDADAKHIVIRYESINTQGLKRDGAGNMDQKTTRRLFSESAGTDTSTSPKNRKKVKLGNNKSVKKKKTTSHISSEIENLLTLPPILRAALYDESQSVFSGTPKKRKYQRLIVENDGTVFRSSDWGRLKRIAEGNPDETKIGAFGVGFYSVFSECDEPTVYSGKQAMSFYWEGGASGTQLMTKTAKVPPVERDGMPGVPWTVFDMPYRSQTELPDLAEFVRFLATSLVFVKLESIAVYADDVKLFLVEKREIDTPSQFAIPNGHSTTTTASIAPKPGNTNLGVEMKLVKATLGHVAMKATYIHGLFASEEVEKEKQKNSNDGQAVTEKISLEITTGHIITNITSAVTVELTRAILKPPPRETTIKLISGQLLPQDNALISKVFSHIIPPTTPQNELPVGTTLEPGRVFIGFQTHQTTGFQCHISTHSVIPTVERENIDFNSRCVREWNIEMIKMAGVLVRCMYHHDLSRIQVGIMGTGNTTSNQLESVTKSMMQKYAFRGTTPASIVGDTLKDAFFAYSPHEGFAILSTAGFKDATLVAIPGRYGPRLDGKVDYDWQLEEILINTPLIRRTMFEASPTFLSNVQAHFGIRTVTVEHIVQELRDRRLSTVHARALLSWLVKRSHSISGDDKLNLDPGQIKEILSVAVVDTEGVMGLSDSLNLGAVRSYPAENHLHKGLISFMTHPLPFYLPLPPTCIPISCIPYSLEGASDTFSIVFGWKAQNIVEWIEYNGNANSLLSTEPFTAMAVLKIASDGWHSTLSAQNRHDVKKLLQKHTCIPTESHGLMKPDEVYFDGVIDITNEEIPIINIELNQFRKDFLEDIGIRRSINIVRILRSFLQRNLGSLEGVRMGCQAELMHHIENHNYSLPQDDIEALKSIAFCSAEGHDRLFRPEELYAPIYELYALGLPVMLWPQQWETTSWRAKSMFRELGLRSAPTLPDLVLIAADTEREEFVRFAAISYILKNWEANNYHDQRHSLAQLQTVKFLPIVIPEVQGSDLKETYDSVYKLGSIQDSYSEPGALLFGYPVLQEGLIPHAKKFMIENHPPFDSIALAMILRPPKNPAMAKEMFTAIAKLGYDMDKEDTKHLSCAPIIPIPSRKVGNLEPSEILDRSHHYVYQPPHKVFINSSSELQDKISLLFDYVDYGHHASQVLEKLGAKRVPDETDRIKLLVRSPERVFEAIGHEEYLSILKQIALGPVAKNLDTPLGLEMRSARFLLSDTCVEKKEASGSVIDEKTVGLACARRILIVDDYNSYKCFRHQIRCCPQEDDLEKFYLSLGANRISAVVQMSYKFGNPLPDDAKVVEVKELIQERTPIFFSDSRERPKILIAPWLERISVRRVEEINCEKTIPLGFTTKPTPIVHKQTLTTVIPYSDNAAIWGPKFDGNTVWITPSVKSYDIAFGLVNRLCLKTTPGSQSLMDYILREPVSSLEERGYNVKRILKTKEAKSAVEGHHDTQPPPVIPLPLDNTSSIWADNMKAAISSAQPFKDSYIHTETTTSVVPEVIMGCDTHPGQNIVFATVLSNSMKIFLERDTEDKMKLMARYRPHFEQLAAVASVLVLVFGIDKSTIHLTYLSKSRVIAFNYKQSVFFNLRHWFREKHDTMRLEEVLPFWYITLCHELAHNVFHTHNTDFWHLTEKLAIKYIPELSKAFVDIAKIRSRVAAGAKHPGDSKIMEVIAQYWRNLKGDGTPLPDGFADSRKGNTET